MSIFMNCPQIKKCRLCNTFKVNEMFPDDVDNVCELCHSRCSICHVWLSNDQLCPPGPRIICVHCGKRCDYCFKYRLMKDFSPFTKYCRFCPYTEKDNFRIVISSKSTGSPTINRHNRRRKTWYHAYDLEDCGKGCSKCDPLDCNIYNLLK